MFETLIMLKSFYIQNTAFPPLNSFCSQTLLIINRWIVSREKILFIKQRIKILRQPKISKDFKKDSPKLFEGFLP